MEELLTIRDVYEDLKGRGYGHGYEAVRKWFRAGKFPGACKIGGIWFISQDDFDKVMQTFKPPRMGKTPILPDKDVRTIRSLGRGSLKQAQIAKMFGISEAYVSRIIKGERRRAKS